VSPALDDVIPVSSSSSSSSIPHLASCPS
jgi:hypothetical protein